MNALSRSVASVFELPLVEAVGWSLVHFLWQGAVVAGLLAVVLWTLRRVGPGPRYLAACAGLLLMAACPLATLAWSWPTAAQRLPIASAPVAPREDQPSSATAMSEVNAPLAASSATLASPPAHAPAASLPAQRGRAAILSLPHWSRAVRPLLPWLVAVWLLGVAALALRLCVGWLRVQRLRRREVRPVAAEWESSLARLAARVRVSRPVLLLESALVEVPTVIGWLRPAILLPASVLVGLAPRQLEAILAHELAHIRRHDYLANLVQTALESLLFYHPAVWWLSRVIRAEREACCDAIAIEVAHDRIEYARALASLEELRSRPRLAVAATDGPLAARIRRILGAPVPQRNRSAWWVVAAVAAGVVAMFAAQGGPTVQAEGPTEPVAEKPADPPVNPDGDWGPESGGLRCRLVAVPTTTDDEAPDATQAADQFAGSDEVTFAVELKNVGDKTLTLLDARNDPRFLAPYLFEFDFTDPAGKPLPSRPKLLGGLLELLAAATHDLEPGASLTLVLRPSRFMSPADYNLSAGEYRARVRYRGPNEGIVAGFAKHWPDKPHSSAWSGEVTLNEVAFTVADAPQDKAELVWGEAHEGLQAAVEFRPLPGAVAPDDPPGTVPLNAVLEPVFHLKNVGEKVIPFTSETWRQKDDLTVTDEAGAERQVSGIWYTGLPIMARWPLQPGEVAEVHAYNLGIAVDEAARQAFGHPVGISFIAAPGKYLLRYAIHIGNIQTGATQADDWHGFLSTGQTPLVLRARTLADDERVRVPTFTGKIEFVDPNGARIKTGTFSIGDTAHEIHAGPIDVADCVAAPQAINVVAPGYEEARFNDVQFTPEETRRIELKPAAPTRFRLVSASNGAPIAGAKVRHFTKSCANASAGPVPMQGIEGPVWTVSQADGSVALDTLQRIDPHYPDLGDAVYYLYIEPAPNPRGGFGLDFAPRFLGPVRAGQDLGDVPLGKYLEVRGEVRGTPEHLDHFVAEWDQPFELTNDNPISTWLYAVSQPLETKREGDRLTFGLTNLRPGTLRIIANFDLGTHHVQHTYGRRDPTGNDRLVELDLTESVVDLVVTPESGRRAEEE